MEPLYISSQALYELIIQPTFNDIVPNYTGAYRGTLSEFTLYDNISLAKGTPIIDIFSKRNILQRKDVGCDTNWKQIAKGSSRKITVDELYGAVKDCQEEFYQGCLKDFREHSDRFRNMIMDFFNSAIRADVTSNSYFGDITRPGDKTDEWSWNIYDGIFVKYAKYIEQGGALAPTVLEAIPSGDISGAEAYDIFNEAYKKQSVILKGQANTNKAFYVSWDLANALEDYYAQIGTNGGLIGYIMNGIPTLHFKGIPIFVEPIWQPILDLLNGGKTAHALILTLRGNFIFGTNKDYGWGAELKDSLKVWFDEDDEVWKYKIRMVGGTEIVAPQHTVMALTDIKK